MGGSCSSSTTGSEPDRTKGRKRHQQKQRQQQQQQQNEQNSQQQRSQEPLLQQTNINSQLADGKRPTSHFKCRNGLYGGVADVSRYDVPDDRVTWAVTYEGYEPIEFFAVQPIPIEEDEDFRKVKVDVIWNERDGHVDRKSHQGAYEVVGGVPRNPVGRTGVIGRGKLARWGPNHAADPVVTRWKRDENGENVHHEKTGRPVLQFVSIQRGDTHEWAIPGGFVDSGEEVNNTLKREFCEETMDSTTVTEVEKEKMMEKLNRLFTDGTQVYMGYVDDPRNTDNSWMETRVFNFHDDTGELVGQIDLHAGDDAIGVQWQDISSSLDLYASHSAFIQQVAGLHNCHW